MFTPLNTPTGLVQVLCIRNSIPVKDQRRKSFEWCHCTKKLFSYNHMQIVFDDEIEHNSSLNLKKH